MKNRLDSLEKKINIKFKDEKLALKALTHKSYLNEHPNLKRNDNERLEFLGDAILEFITTDFLYKKYKSYPEGKLTALRSSLVNTRSLTKLAQKINLEQYIFLSKGEKAGKTRSTILANVVESLIGAIYLDQGMKATKKFVTEFVTPKINIILKKESYKNAKGQLQEITQSKIKTTPTYKLLSSTGPEHDKTFKVGVFINEKKIAIGKGKSKQRAQIQAAQKAIKKLK